MHTPKQNPFDALQIQDDACDDDDFDDSHLFTVIIRYNTNTNTQFYYFFF